MAVLPGKRVRDNSIFGTLSASVSAVGTSISSTDLADLSVVSGDHAMITLDPFRQFGDPEIVMVTAHTAASTSATVQRGMYGTVARAHSAGVQWAHAATVEDFPDVVTSTTLPSDSFEGQIVYQTDTDSYRYFDGVSWRVLGAGSPGFLAYAQNIESTPDQTGISVITDLTNLAVTVTVPASRRIKISGYCQFDKIGATGTPILHIREGGTTLQRSFVTITGGEFFSADPVAVITPTAGTHTYKLSAECTAGTVNAAYNDVTPAFILVEDITGTETPFAGNSVPVGVLAQGLVTANQSKAAPQTTVEDVTGLSVNIVVPAGRVLKITAQGTSSAGVALDAIRYILLEDGNQIDQFEYSVPTGLTGRAFEWILKGLRSPSAGAHTYKVQFVNLIGNNAVTNHASVNNVNFIIVEDVTPTPTISSGAPSSTLAYAEVIASQGGITAETLLTGMTVNVSVPAGRRIKVTAFGGVASTVVGDDCRFALKEGATYLSDSGVSDIGLGVSEVMASAILSPSAGSHTYTVTLRRQSGTGSFTFFGATTIPGYVLVEDITGAIWPAGSQVSTGIFASEAWISYTPILSSTGVAPSLGTGSVVEGKYIKYGRTVMGWISIKFGTSGSTAGTGTYLLSLPVPPTPNAITGQRPIGGGTYLFDNSATDVAICNPYYQNGFGNNVGVIHDRGGGGVVTSTSPWTWTDLDEIRVGFLYEATS